MTFTLADCLKAKQQNKLHEWVITYLNSDGNNKKLAKYIDESNYIYADILEYPLHKLKRAMGPEKTMPFKESIDKWENRINAFAESISSGLVVPPLIATDFWDTVHIADGTHRFEALKLLGYKKYWTIFFIKDPINKENILESQ